MFTSVCFVAWTGLNCGSGLGTKLETTRSPVQAHYQQVATVERLKKVVIVSRFRERCLLHVENINA